MTRLTSDVIEGFSKLVLSKNFDGYKPTPQCHREWWDLCVSEHTLVAICAPRGHAKSTAITHCYTLAATLFKERSFVVVVSDTYEQAVLFLQDMKKELTGNEDLMSLFGVEKLEKDSESDIIVRMQGGHRFRIMAKGAEQKMRGLKWDGKRPDLIVCDDLENDEIVMNQERREKFRKWFFNAVLPCRSDTGIIRVVGTILHMDSLLERLMPKDWDVKQIEKGHIVKEPLRSYYNFKKFKRPWYSVRYRAHTEDFSEILWETKWPKSRLLEERQKYVDAGSPEGYSQEYLNYPIDESVSYFRRGDFLVMNEKDLNSNNTRMLRYYVGVDLAITEKSRSDFTVFAVGGMDEEGYLHIVDVIRERMDAKGIVDMLFAIEKRYHPERITIEGSMIEKSLGPFIQEEMHRRGEYLSIGTETPTKDKETRAQSLQGRMRSGGVKFNKGADWYYDLEQEMLQFPRGRNDDQVDAMAWLGFTINKMHEASTAKEIEEEQWQHEYDMSGLMEQGRSTITGY